MHGNQERKRNNVIVRVVPYDNLWPARYETEAKRIREAVGTIVVSVHHIGSTAVPDLAAKPIIDILVEVSGLAKLDARAHALESLGYEPKGEFGIPGRRYFRLADESGVRTHQIHAFQIDSPHVARHLAFRDYLIARPGIARAYGELKLQLAGRYPDDIDAYMKVKTRS